MSTQREMESPGPAPARVFVILLYLAVSLWYFHWRLGSFNPEAMVFSWVLYCAEVFGLCTNLLHIFMTWRLTTREPPHASPGLSVDVFIPTINEPVDLVRRTLTAALHIAYPHQTWLLDDGNRRDMSELAQELGCHYLARSENENAKAGNLNHALAHSEADFVAVFDADHAPHKNFLDRTLGFFSNPRVAFVQTPQDFYNLDSYQHRRKSGNRTVWTEQSLFFRVIQRGKDYWNAAFYCGSCGVLRRSALDSIGGFGTGTVTEDLHTSIKLHKRGYRSVYYAEALAFGIAPPSVVPYLRQRTRWGQGAMQVWRKEGLLTAKGLTLQQRLCYLASMLTYFDGWQKAVFYFSPVLALTTGVLPVKALGWEFFQHFIPFYLLTFLVLEELARGYGRTVLLAQYNMARFFAFAWATLGLFRRALKFRVTQKGLARIPRFRLYIVPQYLVFALNAMAIPLGFFLHGINGDLPDSALIANIVWAAINCALASALLYFTDRQSANRRAEYRFPVPLPAKIKASRQHAIYGTVDDISPSGVRIHARIPGSVETGTQVNGEIYLPHRVLPFSATVCSLVPSQRSAERYVKAVGCRFDERDGKWRAEIEHFLYGSDLQWRIQHLEERARTLMDRLTLTTGTNERRVARWAPVIFESPQGDSASRIGLVSSLESGQAPRILLTFTPLALNSRIIAFAFSRAGQSLLQGEIISEERLESPVAPIFLYHLVATVREQEWIKNNISQIIPLAARQFA